MHTENEMNEQQIDNPLLQRSHDKKSRNNNLCLIFSTTSNHGFLDKDHKALFDDAVDKYKKLKYVVTNKNNQVLYNRDDGSFYTNKNKEISSISEINSRFQEKNQKITIIISSHGGFEDFLGVQPGTENKYMEALAMSIKNLFGEKIVNVKNIVMEACYSGLELDVKLNNFENKSPSRTLSDAFCNFGEKNITIWGFRGVLAINKVRYKEYRNSQKLNAVDDIVGFTNGEVVKFPKSTDDQIVEITEVRRRRTDEQRLEIESFSQLQMKKYKLL